MMDTNNQYLNQSIGSNFVNGRWLYDWRYEVRFKVQESKHGTPRREHQFTHSTLIVLSFRDRIRILFGANVKTISHMASENPPGYLQADDVVTVIAPPKIMDVWR